MSNISCGRCGRSIPPGETWDRGRTGIEHARCNRKFAGRGLSINVYGIPNDNAAAIGSAVDWAATRKPVVAFVGNASDLNAVADRCAAKLRRLSGQKPDDLRSRWRRRLWRFLRHRWPRPAKGC